MGTKLQPTVKQIKVLSARQARRFADAVLKYPQLFKRTPWPDSDKNVPFFALGESAYLNRLNPSLYLSHAKKVNRILRKEFGELYELLEASLEKELKQPVRYRKDASLPGFHLMLSHKDFQRKAGNWHFDFDFELLKWKKPVDVYECVSFTLALELPSTGARLEFGDRDFEAFQRAKKKNAHLRLRAKCSDFVEHKLGYMVLQRGPILHRIAAIDKKAKLPFKRITLQGLAVKQGDVWQIFW